MPHSTRKIKPASSLDVANRAGVSRTTVSFVLNNRPDVSLPQETRDRVIQAAADLNYRPSRIGRALATGRTHLVAVWLPYLHTPYYATLMAQLSLHRHREYEAIIRVGTGLSSSGRSTSLGMSVDGIIAVDLTFYKDAFRQEHPDVTLPLVSVSAFEADAKDAVVIDLTTGAEAAIRHLLQQGCSRIAYLVQEKEDRQAEARFLAYTRLMAESGRPTEFILSPSQHREVTYGVVYDYFQRADRPDGVFCENDDMAIAANRALCDLGVRVPQEVALVGCDGVEDTNYQEPRLSTIVQPFEEIGRIAWDFLEQRLAHPTLPPQRAVLPASLDVRASSRRTP